jgi:Cu+-exporting ATPase
MAIDPICGLTVDEATAGAPSGTGRLFIFAVNTAAKGSLPKEPSTTPNGHSHRGHPHQRMPEPKESPKADKYVCPMCEGVESNKPGNCPKCGMALETGPPCHSKAKGHLHLPDASADRAGPSRPVPDLWMDLEPKTVEPGMEDDDSELQSMTQRFGAPVLTVPVLLLAMLPMFGVPIDRWFVAGLHSWIQLLLSTPVVLWAGWPFFVRGWRSIVTWNVNMFTLIAIGTGAAYLYSLVAVSPTSFPNEGDRPAKMLISVAPAGLEKMFFEFGVPLAEGATIALPPTKEEIDKLMAIAPNYGIEIVLPEH